MADEGVVVAAVAEESPEQSIHPPPGLTAVVPSPWWRVADCAVLAAWIAVTVFTLRYHEKWADEAQAWLLARDLSLKTIWFHELRYEGTPGLWHTILWIAQHVFHAGYGALGPIGLVCATAGVAVLIFKAPFPRYIRWPLAFTYFFVYQYAVIARPYTLLPLFAFAAAIFFKDRERPERLTIVLVLLANLSLHGTILAGCLGLAYLVEAWPAWRMMGQDVRNRYMICIGVMALTFLYVVIILWPTPDVAEFAAKNEIANLPEAIKAQQPHAWQKFESVISGAFMDYWAPSLLLIVLAGAWCYSRRKLIAFVLPVGSLIALYVVIHGYAHHHGTVFVSAITAFWIAWPDAREKSLFDASQRRAQYGIVALLMALICLSIWDGEVAIRRDYLYPYSGADDAAKYLKSVGADRTRIVGFLYGMVGVQAYFDHNIFANFSHAYYHHGLPLEGFDLNFDEFRRMDPEYVVVFTEQPHILERFGLPELLREGYEIVHFSDGYMIYKQGVYVRQVYFILRRTRPTAWRTP